MRLVYLRTALRDLVWMRDYYERVFPEGTANARKAVLRMETLVLDNPFVGRAIHRPEVKKLLITRTPFFVLYRPTAERIEILRVIDGRSVDGMGNE